MKDHERAIAIVGVGAILPDAMNPTEFWNNLIQGRYSITETPNDRWSIADYYDPDPSAPDKTYSKIGAWVRGFEFDWKKFKIPPKVAAAMDQGQQWAVTIATQALDDYGYPNRPLDTERTGVILGQAMGGELHYITTQRIVFPEFAHALEAAPDYRALPADVRRRLMNDFHAMLDSRVPPISEDTMPGELANIVSGRVANVLNLRGPNFITDAACASSLAALDAAFELLTEFEADAVITGGVDRNMGVSSFVKFCKIGALSATGTRPFGKGADGFVMGEGSAAFLLKRLEDAERARDKIYAVVRGVGGSSDGKGKGITAPNPIGQQLATRRAWENAGLDPATAVMVEAHGTSTRVGDVVEVDSLTQIFGASAKNSIALGSVKSNIGHLKAGAGAAGLLKAVLSIHHKIIPPTLHCQVPNPDIPFEQTPFYLIHEPREMEKRNGIPRRVGVSAYGFGGTNFHAVLEEHVPGMLTEKKLFASANVESSKVEESKTSDLTSTLKPPRGILAMGAANANELKNKLDDAFQRVNAGYTPPVGLPNALELKQRERIVIDFGNHDELLDRLDKARKALGFDTAPAWKALQAQGIFRGSGPKPGKIAFLFPGQGSQYLNMGRELAKLSPVVAQVLADADRVMTLVIGKPLTQFVFNDSTDPEEFKKAEKTLTCTEYCQPAMLTLDTAIYKLLAEFGFKPDMVMGHSLGEYAALIAAGIMPFDDSLRAAAARGTAMAKVTIDDTGWMAAVMAPIEIVEQTLKELDGYVVMANINSKSQSVIGGASKAVEKAIEVFNQKDFQAQRIPVSHAFHTKIVAPASEPLRKFLDNVQVRPPQLPLIANVTGELYPQTVEEIKDILKLQIASPVQWVKGLETLYASGARAFVEVGPKKALKGFVDDVLGDKADVVSLFTNHPKVGELPSFNQALCGLYAAGYGADDSDASSRTAHIPSIARDGASGRPTFAINQQGTAPETKEVKVMAPSNGSNGSSALDIAQLLSEALSQRSARQPSSVVRPYDRNETPLGSVVITGTGLGLPGAEKSVMDLDNALRILRGEQFVDLIPERFRKRMLEKQITRLVKSEDGSGRFETITNPDEVIKLAGRPGYFNLAEEYGVPEKLIEALDITTQLAMAAGLDALREAGIPLVQTYKKTSKGTFLPDRWLLPEAMQDETGVIFASAFPGGDRFADEFTRYYTWENRKSQVQMLEDLRQYTADPETLNEIQRRINELREFIRHEPYEFDRRFIFRVLAMGHSQFAEYIGARGPNTHVNAACASTTQAIGLAEDWIRTGRARHVIVIAADDPSGDHLMEWLGAGFLATGAAATDDRVDEAALPFDRRRHGTIVGMGACALVVESEDAVRERGMRGIVELLASETNNSAFHGTRLDVEHISQVMNNLITSAERRFGLQRNAIAPQTVFMSHETFTPARGGSASAEVFALRRVFGELANDIIVANTKGFTGHPFGVGVEDVIAAKILEYGIVPPVPNYKEVDPELGTLNLSRGGRYPVQYALHLAAGFGSQIALTLTRRIPGALDRVDNNLLYQRWLADVSGYARAETEVVKRVLRVKAQGAPNRTPLPRTWQYGTGPVMRALVSSDGAAQTPARMVVPKTEIPIPKIQVSTPKPQIVAPAPTPRIEPEPVTVVVRQKVNPEPVAAVPVPAFKPEPVQQINVEPPPRAHEAQQAIHPAVDDVTERVLGIVAEKTGYPKDMLDLDLDLEADLGIDTVKQAETFAAIREQFNIPRKKNLKLRDYKTLAQVISFVRHNQPELKGTEDGGRMTKANEPIAPSLSSPVVGQPSDIVADQILQVVAEKTGYPKEMLDLDLDLEADLGIDTVKQAETFAAIREHFNIPRQDNLKLRDYPTLRHTIDFVYQMRQDLAHMIEHDKQTGELPPSQAKSNDTPSAHLSLPGNTDPVLDKVLEVVAEKTGYPRDMLDPSLDLEADLGIDTVKQAETFAAIRGEFDIPRRDDLKLRDYPTLTHVANFVREMKSELAAANSERRTVGTETTRVEAMPAVNALPAPVIQTIGSLEEADRIPRRIPTPVLRPALDLCKATGVTLDESTRVVVMLDRGGVGKALVWRLQKRGVTTLAIDEPLDAEALDGRIKAWLSEGEIHGVYWLPALDVEPNLEEMDAATWHEANRVRVKNLHTTMRALYESIRARGRFLISATRLGGLHGYGDEGASAPLGGAVTGFTKAYKRERNDVLVKAVDFKTDVEANDCADALIAETLSDPGVVEVGYWNGNRFSIALQETPARDGSAGMRLTKDTVLVVTGAAGGITSAIITDLAANSRGTFYLLDLVPAPDAKDSHIALFRTNKEALKLALIEEAKAKGEKPTPVQIDKQIFAIEREEAALRAIESVQAAGGTAYYHSVNLLDAERVAAIIEEIRTRHGRIDVIVHAGGLEISRALPNKDAAQFDLVFAVKADGFFNLLHAAKGMPIGAMVAFSSVAGRFGNSGQTDYSAANDLLCKITSSLRQWRPETRGIVIDWTAWGGIGMATRGSIPKIMEAAGIDMLPPESGVPTVRRELTASAFKGEIVVAGRLGILTQELDETGGLDVEKVNAWLAERKLLMVGKVKSAKLYGGVEVETTLDPNAQPFLYDHQIDGTPLLPGVMGTETFAELASALASLACTYVSARTGAPDYVVAAVENEHFERPFKFYRMQPQTLYLSAMVNPLSNGDLLAHATLKSVQQFPRGEMPAQAESLVQTCLHKEKVHFTADVRLTRSPIEKPSATPPAPFKGKGIGKDDIYRIYFHGPAYRVLERANVMGDQAVGWMSESLPPNANPEDAAALMAPRLIELCFQTAGIWQIRINHVMALPLALESVSVCRQPNEANGARLYALVQAIDNGAKFDAVVVDERGCIYLKLNGYRTVHLPGDKVL